MTANLSQTLDQRRAQHAWNAIQRVASEMAPGEQEEYAGEAKKLPIRVMTSGLGQALAFIASKAKEKKRGLNQLQDDLTDWVLHGRNLPTQKPDSLLQAVCFGDAVFLRRATDEVLAYLEWLNRFAEAEGIRNGSE
ncbi:MAG: hypothetical protein KatS3mg111_0628 [Pirellulaceae bacterium]|nr:MAG: hypothetical protein KatS3mg111_0628 [Pirellulaceae bacterium]